MSVYSFQVSSRGGSASFKYSIEAESYLLAYEQVIDKYDVKYYHVITKGTFNGTMEEYIGAESVARIEVAKDNLRKAHPQKKRSYAAIKKAVEK